VRVYVVGDVQRPGGYDISSLATPLSALYAAGGPTAAGSLRTLRHFRGQQLVEEVDLYDFLLHGVRNGSSHFESGDTLLIPPAGPQVAVYGAVKRPAIYEVKAGETSLAAFLNDAGGVTVTASLGHIVVERIDANRQRETVTLKLRRLIEMPSLRFRYRMGTAFVSNRSCPIASGSSIWRAMSRVRAGCLTRMACTSAMYCIATATYYPSPRLMVRLSVSSRRIFTPRPSILTCPMC
jgi:protein involved in polysaccharide export with SLBB domain